MCRLCDKEEESFDHLWLRCPAFDADRQRMDRGASLDELVRPPERAQALLRIILRRLGEEEEQQQQNQPCARFQISKRMAFSIVLNFEKLP